MKSLSKVAWKSEDNIVILVYAWCQRPRAQCKVWQTWCTAVCTGRQVTWNYQKSEFCIYMFFCCNSSLLNREVKFCLGKMSSGILAKLTTWQKRQYTVDPWWSVPNRPKYVPTLGKTSCHDPALTTRSIKQFSCSQLVISEMIVLFYCLLVS